MNVQTHLEWEQVFRQSSAWLNDLMLLEKLDVFERKDERKELHRMLSQARHEREMALIELESLCSATTSPLR